LEPATLDGAELVIDALFGAGLDRPLDGAAAAIVQQLASSAVPVVAVDLPSGVHGDTGAVLGCAAPATLTVTFARRKPAHLLFPGRSLAGWVVVDDIGIPPAIDAAIEPLQWLNDPAVWRTQFPVLRADGHKFNRGHTVIVAGAVMTGAGRLAALAAQRVGAGVVSVLCPPEAQTTYAGGFAAKLVAPLNGPDDLRRQMGQHRRNAVLLGPGNGVSPATRAHVLAALKLALPTVLDADAIAAFIGDPTALYAAIAGPTVLTPHPGEFRALFAWSGDRLADARTAARQCGGVVVLKGADTIVAAPDGRRQSTPTLRLISRQPAPATSWPVSRSVCCPRGWPLSRRPVPQSGCTAPPLRGWAPGLIADDLPGALPAALGDLRTIWQTT